MSQNIESVMEEEGPDLKQLFDALRELTKDGKTFNFYFSAGGKGYEYFYDSGLDDALNTKLINWMDNYLIPASEYHCTGYSLTIKDDIINLDCEANWGGWLYENLHTYEEIFNEEIVNILLPDIEFKNVNLDNISIAFYYSLDDAGYDFSWPFDVAEYYIEEKNKFIKIQLKDLKTKLEPLFHGMIRDFQAEGSIDKEGSRLKTIAVEADSVIVEENLNFKLSYNINDF